MYAITAGEERKELIRKIVRLCGKLSNMAGFPDDYPLYYCDSMGTEHKTAKEAKDADMEICKSGL